MDSTLHAFEKRQKALRRKHQRMARGYVNKMGKDGLIVQTPDQKVGGIGFKILIGAIAALIGFKALVLAGLGEADYLANVAALEAGNGFERTGALIMQIDPVSGLIADGLAPLFSPSPE